MPIATHPRPVVITLCRRKETRDERRETRDERALSSRSDQRREKNNAPFFLALAGHVRPGQGYGPQCKATRSYSVRGGPLVQSRAVERWAKHRRRRRHATVRASADPTLGRLPGGSGRPWRPSRTVSEREQRRLELHVQSEGRVRCDRSHGRGQLGARAGCVPGAPRRPAPLHGQHGLRTWRSRSKYPR